MVKQATNLIKHQARRMYEDDGESYAAIGRHFGYGNQTVKNWAKRDGGWIKAGSVPVVEVETETVAAPAAVEFANDTIDTFANTTVHDDGVDRSDRDLRDRLARLEAKNQELVEENQALKPTVDLGCYFTDRVKWITDNSPEGEDFWLHRAEAEFKKENRQRAKDGLPVFNIKDHPDLLKDLIAELQAKAAAAVNRETTEPPSRRVKLLIMRNGMPTIEQIPMENQVNNMGGSLADGIIRYTRKGFKLTDPFLCPRAGCFRAAAVDELQRWLYDGYCTDRHRTDVEGDEKSALAGLQVRDTVHSGIG